MSYFYVVTAYLSLNRLEEARATAQEAQAKSFDSPWLRFNLYQLAFLQNDAAGMALQAAWAVGKPGVEDVLFGAQADTAAYSGRLLDAREFSRRAVASALRGKERETAASYEADVAVREALLGDEAEARARAAAALTLSTARDVLYGAALALAVTANARVQTQTEKLIDDLAKQFPEDTLVQFSYIPTIRAQLAFNRKEFSKAIDVLQAAAPYEFGSSTTALFPALIPIYLRGNAYLALGRGGEAVGEFQKILDHSGVVLNEPIAALAHLGLARGKAISGEKTKARSAYQDFLSLWKDADTDIPILKQAKAEYAKLQ